MIETKKGIRSPWREFEFWFMVVKNAILPRVSIEESFENWNNIKKYLMENNRKRKLQSELLSY